ncbi:MAG TPA: SigE family RNA polymerase sigma factor [Streptosporangiaceae bacterium]|jgi:RNA polymerase sigma-70 factor (sigma-E family)
MTFEQFAAERLPAIAVFAAVLTGDRALAEDVVQDVLIRAQARWPKISALEHPDRYVRKMVVSQFLSARRRSWRVVPSGTGEDVDDRRSPDYAADHAERDVLLAELGKLPAKQRTVLVLRYYEGLSDTEIAAVLGCRPGTIRGYASRALAALRIELAPQQHAAPQLRQHIEEGTR